MWNLDRPRRAGSVLLLLASFASGCAQEPASPDPLEKLPRELTAAEREVIAASNRFAFDLFRETDRLDGEGNLFLSPVSASMALGMAMNGAAGETFSEMRSALGFEGLELQQINASYRGLMELLLGLDRSVETRVANSVWYREGFAFEQSFFDLSREYFSAEVTGLPFAPGDRETINAWVKRATAGRIPDIIDQIDPDHVMFLINAVYFKGSWTERFERGATREDDFHLPGGEVVPVRMMNRQGTYGHTTTPDLEVVDLPYGKEAFSMTVLLPRGDPGVDRLVAQLDDERWRAIIAALEPREIYLSLPRFRLEYKQELNDVLRALGMKSAFVPRGADFSGMSSVAGRDLYISRVMQKSFVQVDEEGTEAAAVTSVEVRDVSMPPAVRIDRPFVFAIRERFSGTILFIGKVVNPS